MSTIFEEEETVVDVENQESAATTVANTVTEEEDEEIFKTGKISFSYEGDEDVANSSRDKLDQSILDEVATINSITLSEPKPVPLPTQPPWLEWSDSYINEETWDKESRGSDYFEDNFVGTDLLNIKTFRWMRPGDIFPDPPSVVKFQSLVIDLISPNAHLCEKSETIRYILSEISELYDHSMQNKLECEGEGTAYVPNYPEDDRRWTPWSHIYSCCKAGVRGEKPQYNPVGKYYVRLYFMGAWRRIAVDDRVPVLPSGRSGLPLTGLNELWPMLLTKALLKIAAVTWKTNDVKRFSTISALTGWMFEWIDNLDEINEQDLWVDFENTLPKFKNPVRIPSWYTSISQKSTKKKFGTLEGGDPFWWMPLTIVQSNEQEDFLFRDAGDCNLTKIRDIVTPPEPIHGVTADLSPKEYIWKMKTEVTRRSSPTRPVESNIMDDNKDQTGTSPSVPTADATKSKNKKGKSGGALDDNATLLKKKSKKDDKNKISAKDKKKDKGGAKDQPKEDEEKDKEKVDLKHKVVTLPSAEETEVEQKEKDEEKDGEIKIKHWSKIKTMVLKDATTAPTKIDARKSRSARKSLQVRSNHSRNKNTLVGVDNQPQGRAEQSENPLETDKHHYHRHHGDGKSHISHKEYEEPQRHYRRASKKSLFVMPSISEILYSVQKYAGIDYRHMVKNWENVCGKDSPIALVVVLKTFPKAEDDHTPGVPSFLQHPIQLTEVRDTFMPRPLERPTTPLWKRFRWKAWAMRKGLIPMEEERSKEMIHAVKAKTPFIFKNDWYEFTELESQYEEVLGESEGYISTTPFFNFKSNTLARSMQQMPPTSASTRHSKTDTTTHQDSLSETRAETAPPDAMSYKTSHHVISPSDKRKRTLMKINVGKRSLNKGPRQPSLTAEKRSSTADDKGGSQTVILHETQLVRGESEEDFDDGSKKQSRATYVVPTSACGSLWFNCDDIAKNLTKFCKFYASQSLFGSCYILRREPNVIRLNLDPIFQEVHSTIPKYPYILTEYKQRKDFINTNVEFDKLKSYHVTNYHLEEKQGIDSGFYLFSDSWTEQEIIISAVILQEDAIKQFTTDAPLVSEDMPVPPPTPNPAPPSFFNQPNDANFSKPDDFGKESKSSISLNLIMEAWDWRKGYNVSSQPLICVCIKDQWIVHVRLPPGRNTFRLWLVMQNNDGPTSKHPKKIERVELDDFLRRKNSTPFTIRIVSQTPIYVGSRLEVQNYMTNPPMIFLKQCERIANNIWGLFSCFGKARHMYQENLRELRQSYCPGYAQYNFINKLVRKTHDTFDELILSLITQYNDGSLDGMMILALRSLFLNPMLGRQFVPPKDQMHHEERKAFKCIFRSQSKKIRQSIVMYTIRIQSYYRGWRVRRLFHLRNKSHPKFKVVEYNVRKIAYLLARETDSLFSHIDDYSPPLDNPDELYPHVTLNLTIDPDKVPPTLMPNPPHWAVDLLRYLTQHNPWLVTIHPHAYCISHQVRIQEVEGFLPDKFKDFSWYPFFREVLQLERGSKDCFCEIDLQVYPQTGIYMKIVNNDNGKSLTLINCQHFIGQLVENKYGYTVLCYRWGISTPIKHELNERMSSNYWKLRVVTPYSQPIPGFIHNGEYFRFSNPVEADINLTNLSHEVKRCPSSETSFSKNTVPPTTCLNDSEIEFPSKLCLRRLTGYYIPNKDFSLCRYVLETAEKKCSISLRFRTSNEKARVCIQVWDCSKRRLVFQETCEGGLIAPNIHLHLKKKVPVSDPRTKTTDGTEEEYEEEVNFTSPSDNNNGTIENERAKCKINSRTSSTSQNILKPRRRFIISIFVVDNSWPLSDREWVYVLYKKRKFLKDLIRWNAQDCNRQVIEKTQEVSEVVSMQEADEEFDSTQAQVSDVIPAPTADTTVKALIVEPPPLTPVQLPPETVEKSRDAFKEKVEDFVSTKRKKTKVDKHVKEKEKALIQYVEAAANKDLAAIAAPTVLEENKAQVDVPGVVAPPPPAAGCVSATLPTPIKEPILLTEEQMFREARRAKVKKHNVCRNLVLKYGGRQSQLIRHLDQPHWILEILTDSKIHYKLKSNKEFQRKRLDKAKDNWDHDGSEKFIRSLCHRRAFLLESLIPLNSKPDYPFNLTDPTPSLYACCQNIADYDQNGFSDKELVDLLQQCWAIEQSEASEPEKRIRMHHKSKRKIKVRKPYGMESYPRHLYKRVERYRQLRNDINELEDETNKLSSNDEDEGSMSINESALGDINAMQSTAQTQEQEVTKDSSSPVTVTQNPEDTVQLRKKTRAGSEKMKSIQEQRKESLSVSKKREQIDKADKAPAGKNKKKASNASKDMSNGSAAPVLSPLLPPIQPVRERDTPPEDRTLEHEIAKLKKHELIGEMVKNYEEFFKQPKTVRDGLLDIIRRNNFEKFESNKVYITRANTGKGIGQNECYVERRKSGETLITEQLLNWAIDYFYHQAPTQKKEAFEDPGEMPFSLLKAMFEDPDAEKEWQQMKNEDRYPLPPTLFSCYHRIAKSYNKCARENPKV